MSLGKSQGGSSQGSSSTFVDPNQAPFLQDLYGNAQGAFQQLQPQLAQQAAQFGQNLNQQQSVFTNNLAQTAGGANPFLQNLQQLGSGQNPYLQQQISGFGGDIQRQLEQSLQGIGQGFISSGQFGGSRQGLAEGQAIGRSLEEFAQGAAGLRGSDLARQAQANQAGLSLQNQAAQLGQGGLQNAFNLGLAPMTSQLGFLGQLGGIFGDPTVLAQSSSKGRQGDSTSLSILS